MKEYIQPQISVRKYNLVNVVTTSNPLPSTGDDNETPFEPVDYFG